MISHHIAAAALFGAVLGTLYVAHQVGDHWLQTSHQAATKAGRGLAAQLATARHVATLTTTKLVMLAIAWAALGLRITPAGLALGLAIDAVTHYAADYNRSLRRLAAAAGLDRFWTLGAPRPHHDDNPSLGTGAYALDQSWHIFWLWIAALIIVVV